VRVLKVVKGVPNMTRDMYVSKILPIAALFALTLWVGAADKSNPVYTRSFETAWFLNPWNLNVHELLPWFQSLLSSGFNLCRYAWFSNTAYLYLSVAFIQMVKAMMPCVVYVVACVMKVRLDTTFVLDTTFHHVYFAVIN
jgi:hypothetical protein